MYDFKAGEVLLVDKPMHWTSFDVVNKIRYHLKRHLNVKKIKVGHAGTLDPLATGLLVICTGKKTKEIDTFQVEEKEYTGTICIGATTQSCDLETELENETHYNHISKQDLLDAAEKLTGEIDQTPPLFSAKKIDGERAYIKARRGEKIELKKNKVTIVNFKIESYKLPYIKFRISCSKGTYIRSIARDFGEILNVGGHLTELRRVKNGHFLVDNAYSVDKWIDIIDEEIYTPEESK